MADKILGSIDLTGGRCVVTTNYDPREVDTDLPKGSYIYDSNGMPWLKLDDGPSKNVIAVFLDTLTVSIGDETTPITTGNGKIVFPFPYAATMLDIRASLNVVSTSGIPTFDINEAGTTILSTKLTIDQDEKNSISAATPLVISDAAIADYAEMSIDVDVSGTGAKGAKLTFYFYRTL